MTTDGDVVWDVITRFLCHVGPLLIIGADPYQTCPINRERPLLSPPWLAPVSKES